MQNAVLVTGATGFIGSHLVEHLIAEGARVRCLVRPVSRRNPHRRYLPPQPAQSVFGDLLTGVGLDAALSGTSVVFHLAGITKALSADEYYAGNLLATENLLDACARTSPQPRLVHVSTLAAAGPSQNGIPLREDAEPNPVSTYGWSKLEAEQAVRRSPLAAGAVILRPPVVYGPRDTDVLAFLRAVSRGFILTIGQADSSFSYIYVADLVEALLLAGACPGAAGKTYFVASKQPVSWREFGAIAAGVMGRKPRVLAVPVWAAYLAAAAAETIARLTRRPGILSREKIREAGQRYWTCDVSLAEADLGFHAATSLREGVATTLEWYRHARWLTY